MRHNYKKMIVWQLADDLAVKIYEITRDFPKEEKFGMTSQIRRAASSVAANIAEGANRSSEKEFIHFLYISRGSLAETEYFLHLSRRLGFLSDEVYLPLQNLCNRVFAALHGLLKSKKAQS